ncbi:MAG: alanine racemase [Methylococcaceae bacterium]|nr:alanine racemase [Methylococcaceae bacterium]
MKPVTYAVLDLEAVQHNLVKVRQIAADAKIMAVIKANGYGHGLLRIAKALGDVDAMAVARIDEAIRLRKAGFNQRLAVLEGFMNADELEAFFAYDLEAMIHCVEQVELIENRAGQGQLSIWLKLDSGMNRLGFKEIEFAKAHQRLNLCSLVSTINLMTHFANADDKNDAKTLGQIRLFKQTVKNYQGECSIANSAGILAWKEALTDWVRPGIMLYGISPFAEETGQQLGLKPVMSLYSQLIAIKEIQKGETVGYSGTWAAEKTTRVGVVAIGYADGYPRHAKIGTPVLVNGQRVPLIGRVSMDMITVDLSSLSNAKTYDPVTLWGEGLAVEEIAIFADTIPYTLVCGVTQRVQILDKL